MTENMALRNIISSSDKKDDPEYVRISMIEGNLSVWAKRVLEKGRDDYIKTKRMKIVDTKGNGFKA